MREEEEPTELIWIRTDFTEISANNFNKLPDINEMMYFNFHTLNFLTKGKYDAPNSRL